MKSFLSISLFLIISVCLQCSSYTEICPDAVGNSAVDVCPASKDEWDRAARRKDCKNLSLLKNCTTELKYHCLINSYRNKTVEVCGREERIFFGYCTEFNDEGRIIQRQRRAKCNSSGFPKCDDNYLSSEAYKYQDCYKLINRSDAVSQNIRREDNFNLTLTILLPVIITVVLSLAVIGLLYWRRQICPPGQSGFMAVSVEEPAFEKLPEMQPINAITDMVHTPKNGLPERMQPFSSNEVVTPAPENGHQKHETSETILTKIKENEKCFVETKFYERGKTAFLKNGIVIWIGLPGCGKTSSALHLLSHVLNGDNTCKVTEINRSEELKSFEVSEAQNALLFIDNFKCHENKDSYKDWWNALNGIYDQKTELKSASVRFIFTARENVIENACDFMKNTTPLLCDSFRIKNCILSKEEKSKIFSKLKEKNCISKYIDESFKNKIFEAAEGPIGFPLCANLFLSHEQYQFSEEHFFSKPISYLKDQIRHHITSTMSLRPKSLFFVLYFHEWQTKREPCNDFEIDNEKSCKKLLEDVANGLQKIDSFDFKGLELEARGFIGLYLQKEPANAYKFVHDSIYEAVGALLCERVEALKTFPLEMIQNQDVLDGLQSELAIRFQSEVIRQNASQVFACKVFKSEKFCKLFVSELLEIDEERIKRFFNGKNNNPCVNLSCLFWTSYNKLTFLTEKLFNIVRKKENEDPVYQLYLSLYGESCAGNDPSELLNQGKNYLKQQLLSGRKNEDMNILHLVISSNKSDDFAKYAVQTLLDAKHPVDVKTKKNMTPLMLAVTQMQPRKKVIEALAASSKLSLTDNTRSNVFHHCLKSGNNDETCAEYLHILLRPDATSCLTQEDLHGNTPLAIAAREVKCSRIRSILLILKHGMKTLGTVNGKGYSPLHLSVLSLKTVSPCVELECSIRVIIFLLYGSSTDIKTDKDENIIQNCKYDALKGILEEPENEEKMETVIKSIFQKFDERHEDNCQQFFEPSIKMNTAIRNVIDRSIQLLQNKVFSEEQ